MNVRYEHKPAMTSIGFSTMIRPKKTAETRAMIEPCGKQASFADDAAPNAFIDTLFGREQP